MSTDKNTICRFVQDLEDEKQRRQICHACPLYRTPIVVLDTNIESFGPVDIVFLGLNPGKDEVIQKLSFVGKAGKILREKISRLPEKTTYLITNLILCHTNSESTIPTPKKVIDNCHGMRQKIFEKFPGKIYVPLGGKAMNFMGIKRPVMEVTGNLFGNIFPMMHPSAVNRPNRVYGKTNAQIFEESFVELQRLISTR